MLFHGLLLSAAGSGGAGVVVTGTLATAPIYREDIVAGGKTLILTLSGDTFVAAGATFDAIRSDIIQGLDASSSPSLGWNPVVRDTMAVTAVVRTSATVCTITLPAFPTYGPTAGETLTVTVPASALTLAAPLVASPTVGLLRGPLLSISNGVTNGSGVITLTLTSDDANTANGEFTVIVATAGNGAISRVTARPA